jgi:inosine-uridine nucleoside N-ribohydrolase
LNKLPLIVDTDVGPDDLMALAYLLNQPRVEIRAITTCNGLAHTGPGARVIAQMLKYVRRTRIPVARGRSAPLQGERAFPEMWRELCDNAWGLDLPPAPTPRADAARRIVETLRAARHPVTILELGPHTNLVDALNRDPRIVAKIARIVMMGGAVHVPGSVAQVTAGRMGNSYAEWNIWVDPVAADIIFHSGVPLVVVPLDATNHAGYSRAFHDKIARVAEKSRGLNLIAQLLHRLEEIGGAENYYFWDPLTAVALLHPRVCEWEETRLEIETRDEREVGRTRPVAGKPNARVAVSADTAQFERLFFEGLVHR